MDKSNSVLKIDQNKRHFEENFEDSETSSISINPNINQEADFTLGEPIQLIRFPYYGGLITIEEEAL